MKVIISTVLLMFSITAFSKVVTVVEEKEGRIVCSDKRDEEKCEPKIIYRDKVKYKTKIVYKDKIIYKDKIVYKDKIIEKPIDLTKKNNISLLIGFPLDVYNYELKEEVDEMEYPLPGLMYTRLFDELSLSAGFALKTGFIGMGYNF